MGSGFVCGEAVVVMGAVVTGALVVTTVVIGIVVVVGFSVGALVVVGVVTGTVVVTGLLVVITGAAVTGIEVVDGAFVV